MSSDGEDLVGGPPPMLDSDVISDSSESASSDIISRLRIRKYKKDITGCHLCVKLTLPEHLAAHMERRELDRTVETIQCSEEIVQKIFGNYLIVKNILSNLRWQEKLICKNVGPLWNSAVDRLQVEQLGPVDFSIDARFNESLEYVELLKSSEFYTEPMTIFTFCSAMADRISCLWFKPTPCSSPCSYDEHSILDIIHQETTSPMDCMFTVKATSMSYMPLPDTATSENTVVKPTQGESLFYGIYIPKVPGIEFKIVNINYSSGIHQDLMPEIKTITDNYTVKGVVACLTENYLLYVDENNAECLAFLNAMQPEKPFAFGGCLVEDTATDNHDLVSIVESLNQSKDFVSGNIMSLGVFVAPKDDGSTSANEPKQNFETYSFVMDSSEWSKLKISEAIQEFSESVPRFEHSVALKFSCMGRQHKHEVEQRCFRIFFPNTRIVGCFGNGELGVNHPRRRAPDSKAPAKNPAKRPREYHAYEKVHSYSTVFFYIGWGKIIEEAERND